jgi:hypothetical protein
MTTQFSQADQLHRLVKEALDSGAASSVAEAETMFRGYRLAVTIGGEAHDPGHQATLLTTVALARRVFLGGVWVSGDLAVPLKAPLPLGDTLAAAVTALGGLLVGEPGEDTPTIAIGGPSRSRAGAQFHVRTFQAGWRAGIIPAHAEAPAALGNATNTLASMLAAALAVSEAFRFVRGGDQAAGRRPLGLSLWDPSPEVDWLTEGGDGPDMLYLPSRLWVVGLGHLGQAYLWALGLLPYADPSALSLVLQDVDVITPSTESTSILTDASLVGRKKTRAMAAWAERRGFTTSIHERLFGADFRRQPDEPAVALCGLDNALGRRALDRVGFDIVVEAGLGRGHRDFTTMRVHTLPGSRAASAIWNGPDDHGADDIPERAAYRKMLNEGVLDQCGVTLLAGKAVGAPFVGAVAASLVMAEVIRLLHGGPVHQVLDLDLHGLDHRSAVLHGRDFAGVNPGFVMAAP